MSLDLTELHRLRVPFEGIVALCFLPERLRLSLSCKVFWSTIPSLPFLCEKTAIENKQVARIARSLGIALKAQPETLRKAGGYAGVLFRRISEIYFREALRCPTVARRLDGPVIRAFMLDLLRGCSEIRVNYFLNGGGTVLHAAAQRGDAEMLQAVIDNGSFRASHHDRANSCGLTALSLACERCVDCALLLARSFAWKSQRQDLSPLFLACWLAHRARSSPSSFLRTADALPKAEELVRLLIAHDAGWVSEPSDGALPIHLPTTPAIIGALLAARADPNERTWAHMVPNSRFGTTALHLHASFPDNVAALLAAKADPCPAVPAPTQRELHMDALLAELEGRGGCQSKVKWYQPSPLHVQAAAFSSESVQLLLAASASVNATSPSDAHTPLHHAARGRLGPATRPILDVWPWMARKHRLEGYEALRVEESLGQDRRRGGGGGDVEREEREEEERRERVRVLLEAGADPDAKDVDGRTPFE